MMTSNNSSLLKDSQELTKTKQTIWKPLIAVSLLSVFSFTSGQYLPYVIAAVSGSGAIAAVPLAVFTVSMVVALISATYLIRLAVSRAGDEKKIDLSGEESGHTASQEPQKLVHENSTNLESELIGKEPNKTVKQDSESQTDVDSGTSSQDKSSVSTSPSQSPQTRDTAVPHVSQEKPVKQDSESQTDVERVIPQNNNASSPSLSGVPPPPPPQNDNTTGEKSPVGTTQKNTSSRKKYEPPKDRNQVLPNLGDILKVRENLKRLQPKNSICGQQGAGGSMDDSRKALEYQNLVVLAMRNRYNAMNPQYSDNECSKSEHSGSDSGDVPDNEDWDTDPDPVGQASSGSPLSKERSWSFDSGHGSGSEPTSPLHSVPKAKPPIPPKPVNLKTKPEAPPATTVTEVKDPSIPSFKDRMAKFGGEALPCQKQFVARRQ